VKPASRRVVSVAALATAAVWPFLVPSTAAHRVGVLAAAAALVGLSLLVAFGWLRAVTLYQPGAAGAGAWVAAAMLGGGHALPLALLAAAVTGGVIAVLALALAGPHPRALLPVSSLLVTGAVSLVFLPGQIVRPFARPVLLGADLAGDRALYMLLLGVLVAGSAMIATLARSDVGRRLAALGADQRLALRSGVNERMAWLQGIALSGALAGLAGAALTVLQRGLPELGQFSVALAAAYLAIPLVGGAWSLPGVLAAAAGFAVLPAVAGTHGLVVGGTAALLAAATRPDGVAGIVRGVLAALEDPRGDPRWERVRRESAP
jgi:ABC-type branched-subunit amino acid transport system permease subunit